MVVQIKKEYNLFTFDFVKSNQVMFMSIIAIRGRNYSIYFINKNK